MARKYSFLLPCLLIVLCISCFGCVSNILSVREFSKATMNASDTFSAVADDIPKSCKRRVETGSEDSKLVIKNNTVEYAEDYLNQLSTCDTLKTSVDGILNANVILRSYAEALGALAADNPVTFTTEVDNLKKSLDSVEIGGKKSLAKNKVDSISDIAAYVFSAAANGYRQEKLKDAIKNNQGNLEQLIQGLILTLDDYNAELRGEGIQVSVVQDDLVNESRKPQDKHRLSDAELNKRLLDTKKHLDMIETKKNAVKDCAAILKSISDSHKKLTENIDKLDKEEMIKLIQKYTEDLTPLIRNVRKAYSS